MLKKITILIITCLFAISALSGCIRSTDNVVSDIKNALTAYWKDYSKDECKQLVADALKEKYGEEFVVTDIGTGSGGSYYSPGYLKATCHPKNDETIYFEAEYFEYGKSSYELYDVYIQSIVSKQIKDIIDPVLAEHFDDFATDVYIYGLSSEYDSGIRNVSEATIESFSNAITENEKENLSVMWIILEESQIKEQDEMLKILSKFTEKLYKTRIAIEVHYVPQEVLDECQEFIKSTSHNPRDINTIIRSKYLLHKYSYVGTTQTLSFSRAINYEELTKNTEG